MSEIRLRVSEIYKSIQGESTHAGRVCTFIRLAGCNLRCAYCDTPYALSAVSGEWWNIEDILARVRELGTGLVELTGGEPLLQKATPALAARLLDEGFEVLIETSGSFDIDVLPSGVKRIMDVKGPCSGEIESLRQENLEKLQARDEVKFVLHDREEYEWARGFLATHQLDSRCTVLFSPVFANSVPVAPYRKPVDTGLAPKELAAWILEDNLPVRLQLQQHKYIWSPEARGV